MPPPARSSSLDLLRERIRQIETPARHGVLPFGVAAIDGALPGGGLALGGVHEILGADGDEEDGAAAAGFIAGILARLGCRTDLASRPACRPGEARNPLLDRPDAAGSQPRLPSFATRKAVMPGLVPAIHECSGRRPPWGEHVDARIKSGHDDFAGSDADAAATCLRERGQPQEAADHDAAVLASLTAGKVDGRRSAAGAGLVLWCLKRPDLYGPGLMAHGLDPGRLVLVTAPRDDEILWTVEEGLHAGPEPGVAAVVGEIGRLPMVAGRRLQLAAEHSGVTAFLLRRWRSGAEAAAERERPSAALTRWRITALPSLPENPLSSFRERYPGRPGVGRARWRVELLRVRGGRPGAWDVEVADATGLVFLSADLADRSAAPPRRSAAPLGGTPLSRHAG